MTSHLDADALLPIGFVDIGQTVRIELVGTEDTSLQTSFFIDDTAVTENDTRCGYPHRVCSLPASGGPASRPGQGM